VRTCRTAIADASPGEGMSGTLMPEPHPEEERLEALSAKTDPAGGRVAWTESAAPALTAMAAPAKIQSVCIALQVRPKLSVAGSHEFG